MFSTKEMLIRRTGKNKVGRFEFLKLLVEEFKETNSEGSKEQVLANLANFAYDPINYQFIRKLHIIDVFLDELSSTNEKLAEYSIAGVCNLCLDPENKEYILSKRGVAIVANCLFHRNDEVVISAITTLMFLITPTSKADITCPEIVECMVTHLRNPNKRIKNLATVFLDTCCSKKQVSGATNKVDSKLGKPQAEVKELGNELLT